MQRRVFLQGTVGMAALLSRSAHSVAVSAAPSIKVEERRVISRQPNHYHGWPTLTQRKNGQLLLVSSAGRESHICPFGRVELMASKDQGSSWSWPRVLLDGPIDDRDAGILETQQGTLLATTFSSVAYVPILEKGRQIQPGKTGAWEPERLAR